MIDVIKIFNELSRAIEIIAHEKKIEFGEIGGPSETFPEDGYIVRKASLTLAEIKLNVAEVELLEMLEDNKRSFGIRDISLNGNTKKPSKCYTIKEEEQKTNAALTFDDIVSSLADHLNIEKSKIFDLIENVDGQYRRSEKIVNTHFVSELANN